MNFNSEIIEWLRHKGVRVPRVLYREPGFVLHEGLKGKRLDGIRWLRFNETIIMAAVEAQIAIEDCTGHQHGDYSTCNLLWDGTSIGVVDWEFASRELPPLFDIFSLLTSIRKGFERSRIGQQAIARYAAFRWQEVHPEKWQPLFKEFAQIQLDRAIKRHSPVAAFYSEILHMEEREFLLSIR